MALTRNKETPPGGDGEPKEIPKVILPPPELKTHESASESKSDSSSAKPKEHSDTAAPKPSKQNKKEEGKQNPIVEARQFLKEVVVEFRKISWPPFRQVVRETWSVLFLVAVITIMVLAFDWILARGVFGPLDHFARSLH